MIDNDLQRLFKKRHICVCLDDVDVGCKNSNHRHRNHNHAPVFTRRIVSRVAWKRLVEENTNSVCVCEAAGLPLSTRTLPVEDLCETLPAPYINVGKT